MKRVKSAAITALIATLLLLPMAVRLLCADALAAAASAPQSTRLGIVMYHSVTDGGKKAGKYVITPKTLEEDLKWLEENGFRTVTLQELEDYVTAGGSLPEKAVMLTFDDGIYNNLSYALPLLQSYGMTAVISPIGRYADEFSAANEAPSNVYSHATWDELGEMLKSGCFEIANHSYDLHGSGGREGVGKKKGEDLSEYEAKVGGDIMKMQKCIFSNLGVNCRFFTYPFGFLDDSSEELIKKLGFTGSFSCYEILNEIRKGDPDCLYSLGRFNRPSGVSSEEFFRRMFADGDKIRT